MVSLVLSGVARLLLEVFPRGRLQQARASARVVIPRPRLSTLDVSKNDRTSTLTPFLVDAEGYRLSLLIPTV